MNFSKYFLELGLKGYFIQQRFSYFRAPEARLKLIEILQTDLGFSELKRETAQGVYGTRSRQILKITKSIAGTGTFHRVPQGR